ncbi:hypothetical protein ALC56_05534, partial [Trachymyrmex septentrionalis]
CSLSENGNESFNATFWAPKSCASEKRVTDIATDIAVCNFNDEFRSIMEIIKSSNLTVGPTCYNFCFEETDARH